MEKEGKGETGGNNLRVALEIMIATSAGHAGSGGASVRMGAKHYYRQWT